ncbi:uncharacterized protein LOC111674257 [Orussus abietinus]|uniref:uncharacterized protein LOC111674257 n=1 Tax=Orussus abietinus TaxID=222816 RepID=UPI000C716171|nr:uncharacterized protein LOC111674257 [Orussus abietinus]
MPVKSYVLNTVTYGTASAPFLATRCLRQIGEDCRTQYPDASRTILKDFYVDDLLTSTDSVEHARELRAQLTSILDSAGFELRKWAANDPRILIQDANAPSSKPLQSDKDPKTLGLLWTSDTDMLRFSVQLSLQRPVTKRTILSEISKIFDPLGLIGPATVQVKLLLQRLWQLQVKWDESLPQDIHTSWMEFQRQLEDLNDLSIHRRILCDQPISTELHGFCDASERAYGACIYVRTTDAHGRHFVRLLCAKSRVAPLKTVSLPRLELCGALLLAQLSHKVSTALNIKWDGEFYWCDSTITLAWIKSSCTRWKTFVANRTAEIQELTNQNWNHVVSAENPADIISRGIGVKDLLTSELWWYGPTWLKEDSNNWPLDAARICDNEDPPEQRQASTVLVTAAKISHPIFEKYSSFFKLIRIVAYLLRFKNNATVAAQDKKLGHLESSEYTGEMNPLLKLVQRESFAKELDELKNHKCVGKTSKLCSLHSFLDEIGLIRVGGRLANASIPHQQKHPIILPAHHRFTELIIINEHWANNELKELAQLLANEQPQNRVSQFLAEEGICWHLIPPHAPHFGGLWESGVRMAKHHLKRVIGETHLTFEELYTMLTQHFWQRWQREYLHQLQQRYKWNQQTDNGLRPGTMVILKEDNLPPLRWRAGRIVELHPGKDDITRVVSIRLSDNVVKRPVSKVCILPIDNGSEAISERQSSENETSILSTPETGQDSS